MSSKLNTQDIIDLLVANNEITKDEAEKFLSVFVSLIEKGLSTDELVKVKDFGTFKLTQIQERESIDVNTQEKIVIPSHRRVSFIPAQNLKGLVNKPFAHFETTPLNEGFSIDSITQDALFDKDDDEDRIDEDEPTNEETTDNADPFVPVGEESKSNDLKVEVDLSTPVLSVEEKEIISNTPTEDAIDTKESFAPEIIPIIDTPKKPKSNRKLRRYILRWDIAIALFMIIGVSLAYSFYFSKRNPSKNGIEESEIPKPIKEVASISHIQTPVSETTEVAIDSVEAKTMKPLKTVKMIPGKTLRLIALDEFGHREFWIYIYFKNKDKIKNPDVVPVGLELVLPYEDEFDMDADNPNHVSKAKGLGDQEMKKFW